MPSRAILCFCANKDCGAFKERQNVHVPKCEGGRVMIRPDLVCLDCWQPMKILLPKELR